MGEEEAARLAVSIGLPIDLLREVDLYAERHGLPTAEALRYLIEAGLAAEAGAMLEAEGRDPGRA